MLPNMKTRAVLGWILFLLLVRELSRKTLTTYSQNSGFGAIGRVAPLQTRYCEEEEFKERPILVGHQI